MHLNLAASLGSSPRAAPKLPLRATRAAPKLPLRAMRAAPKPHERQVTAGKMTAMNGAPRVGLIIAVKHLPAAKSRLAPSLSELTRQRLVIAMLTDTISAAHKVTAVAGVTVVTPDTDVAEAARRLGASVIDDPTPTKHPDPLNNALREAWRSVVDEIPDTVVLQGDLPALRSTELTAALVLAQHHQRSFVTDRHGSGTSALFAFGCPLLPAFGADSARRHRDSGAVELVGQWPGLRCDIDLPADLVAAAEIGVGPATAHVIDEHLSEHQGNSA